MNKIDPYYLFLKYIALRGFFTADLSSAEKSFVMENVEKHRKILWICTVLSLGVYIGLTQIPKDEIATVIFALIAPVTVMGAAWFSISFGSIPQKLISISMEVTFWMFTGFVTSLMAMVIAVMFVTPLAIWPALITIFICAIISCVQYDSADGLKAGLDDALLHHSRAAILFYKKQGISAKEEEEEKTKERKVN